MTDREQSMAPRAILAFQRRKLATSVASALSASDRLRAAYGTGDARETAAALRELAASAHTAELASAVVDNLALFEGKDAAR